mgnify:FL=1|jgi:hypothetical protein
MRRTDKYTVIHDFWGADERDGLTRESVYVMSTTDPFEAAKAARKYEVDNEVGRYFEDGGVSIRCPSGVTYATCHFHNHIDSLRYGPPPRQPAADPNEIPF